jgi:hypothetical protein
MNQQLPAAQQRVIVRQTSKENIPRRSVNFVANVPAVAQQKRRNTVRVAPILSADTEEVHDGIFHITLKPQGLKDNTYM